MTVQSVLSYSIGQTSPQRSKSKIDNNSSVEPFQKGTADDISPKTPKQEVNQQQTQVTDHAIDDQMSSNLITKDTTSNRDLQASYASKTSSQEDYDFGQFENAAIKAHQRIPSYIKKYLR